MAYNKSERPDSPMKRRGGKSFQEESQETVQNIREL